MLAHALVVLAALAIWAQALPGIDVGGMGGLGLITVVPPGVYAAFGVLAFSFSLALRPPRPDERVLLLHLLALFLILDATPVLVEGTPGRPDTWRHLGFAEYILRNGAIDPGLSAYFNWPSFFVLSAFATDIIGNPRASDLAGVWAPVLFNLGFLAPLLLILRSLTPDRRLVWLGAGLFYLLDWVGQDYWAPQAYGYLLYLAFLGVLLRFFASTSEPTRPAQRLGLLVIGLLIFGALLSGHQLTPFFALIAVTSLVVFRVCGLRGLPLLMGVMIATWLLFVAWTFFSGHVGLVLGSIGRIRDTLDANVTDRLVGSPEHVLVARTRLVVSVALWGTGFLLALRRFRRGQRDLAIVLLAFSPFSVLGMQGYGGEIVMRVYLFALPAMAVLLGTAFFNTPDADVGWLKTVMLALLSCGLFGVFLITRYGDERVNRMSAAEIDAMRYVYSVAEPGSLLFAGGPNTSWDFQDIEKYRYDELELRSAEDREAVQHADLDAVARRLRSDTPSYLIVTRSQRVALEDFAGLSPEELDGFVAALRSSPRFRAIYTNPDAAVFVLAEAGS